MREMPLTPWVARSWKEELAPRGVPQWLMERNDEIEQLPLQFIVSYGAMWHDVLELLQLIDWQVADAFAIVETGKPRSEW